MEKIKINEIYVGTINKVIYLSKHMLDMKITNYSRATIFKLNKEGKHDDLLYNCKSYAIKKISDENVSLNEFLVCDYLNLEIVLKLAGYPDEVSKEDIISIPSNIFNQKFIENYSSFFGLLENIDGIPSEYLKVIKSHLKPNSFEPILCEDIKQLKFSK